ncbi:hypothetical protein KDA11_05865 [Candidatus Saccharibacteria bacterium]|nr:hypothetical protein [Candidatus Saccharibacteria bacterium]
MAEKVSNIHIITFRTKCLGDGLYEDTKVCIPEYIIDASKPLQDLLDWVKRGCHSVDLLSFPKPFDTVFDYHKTFGLQPEPVLILTKVFKNDTIDTIMSALRFFTENNVLGCCTIGSKTRNAPMIYRLGRFLFPTIKFIVGYAVYLHLQATCEVDEEFLMMKMPKKCIYLHADTCFTKYLKSLPLTEVLRRYKDIAENILIHVDSGILEGDTIAEKLSIHYGIQFPKWMEKIYNSNTFIALSFFCPDRYTLPCTLLVLYTAYLLGIRFNVDGKMMKIDYFLPPSIEPKYLEEADCYAETFETKAGVFETYLCVNDDNMRKHFLFKLTE